MGSAGVGRTFQLVQRQAALAFSDWSTLNQLGWSNNVSAVIADRIGKEKWNEYRQKKAVQVPSVVSPSNLRTRRQRLFKLLKILLPHIGLNVLLLSYITFGALVFIWLEADSELHSRKMKLRKVLELYELIIDEASSLCHSDFNITQSRELVERNLRPILVNLSWAHEIDDRFATDEQLWTSEEKEMVPRWSFAAAVLYALTVITSTGILLVHIHVAYLKAFSAVLAQTSCTQITLSLFIHH
uniref:MSC domain-containing protein n=1 Tax=Syphacia muris TaxID=451379 RepID=A0A0N5ATF5_9BILA